MKVTFKKPYRFSENGYSVTSFSAGQEYDVSQSCALSAASDGVLEQVKSKPSAPKTAVKPQPRDK